MNFKYLILLGIIPLCAVHFQNVYAVNSIDWIDESFTRLGSSEPPFDSVIMEEKGDILNGLPFTVLVDATDEGNFTSNGMTDTIDVLITSTIDPNVITYTLTETMPDSGIFTGTNFVFLKGNYKFQVTDTIEIVYTEDDPSSECGSDNKITIIDSRSGGPDNGVIVHSDTDLLGIGLVLTETGKNTCQFLGKVKFTTDGSSDENTGTLLVSLGDILAIENQIDFEIIHAQIIPTVNGKGSIIAKADDPNVSNERDSAEVFASYNGLISGLDLNSNEPGGGIGGPANPGFVLNFVRALLGGSNVSSPPTLGIDDNHNRIVEQGFSFNGNPVDVEQFYTPYPLVTTEVGKLNSIKLKVYEERGPENITHVGLSYGLGVGETFNEGRATIEYDITFDGKESITLFDPQDVFGNVNVTTSKTDCSSENDAQCLEITFDHIFREPLEFNMVATNIWDFQRNGWQNYFNHGIEIVGESMNPPEIYYGIYKGHKYKLTENGKNTAIDEEGNSWTYDKIWTRDYVKPENYERDVLNKQKIDAITKLGYDYSDGQEIFGYARTDHNFAEYWNQQSIEAQTIMVSLCPECQKESFAEINDVFSYPMPTRYSKLNSPENMIQMDLENAKAQEFLEQYFQKIYPGKVFD